MNNNYPPKTDDKANKKSLGERVRLAIVKGAAAAALTLTVIIGGAMASTSEAYADEGPDTTPVATETMGTRELPADATDVTVEVPEATQEEQTAAVEETQDATPPATSVEAPVTDAEGDSPLSNEDVGKPETPPNTPDTPNTPTPTGGRDLPRTGFEDDGLIPIEGWADDAGAGIAALGLGAAGALTAKKRREQANNRQNVAPGSRRRNS